MYDRAPRLRSQCRRRLAGAATLMLAAGIAGQSPDPAWSWLTLGRTAGAPQLLASAVGGVPEIVVPCSGQLPTFAARYWIVLRRNAAATDWDEVFASPVRPEADPIVRLALLPGVAPRVVVMTRAGIVEIWDQTTRTRTSSFALGAAGMDSGLLFDIDRDGNPDVVMAGSGGLHAARLDGTPILAMTGIGGSAITAGQMDADASIEVATASGDVVDVDLQTVQFHWQNGFGVALSVLDFDGDGKGELIAAEDQAWLWAFDVNLRLPKWSRYVFDLDCLALANVDADAQMEIVVGGGQTTGIVAIDPVTLAQDLQIPRQGFGVAGLTIGDVDLDGQTELLWVTSSDDKVVIADLATQAIEWSSDVIPTGAVGPARGDIDGDGIEELVYATGRDGLAPSRILVVDPATHQLKGRPNLPGGRTATDLDLVDVDGDGDLEIAVVDSGFSVLDYANGQVSTLWRLGGAVVGLPSAAELVDLDGDGNLEAVVASGTQVRVFDYGVATELWRTPAVPESLSQLVVAQLDGDAALEIVVMRFDGDLHVFDAVTHAEQAHVVSGVDVWSTFGVLPANVPGAGLPQPGFVVGDAAGGVTVLVPGPGAYGPIGPFPIATAPIDGVRWIDGSTMFVFGAAGRLQANDLLTPLWRSNEHGADFGRRTLVDVARRTLTTAGVFGVSTFQF